MCAIFIHSFAFLCVFLHFPHFQVLFCTNFSNSGNVKSIISATRKLNKQSQPFHSSMEWKCENSTTTMSRTMPVVLTEYRRNCKQYCFAVELLFKRNALRVRSRWHIRPCTETAIWMHRMKTVCVCVCNKSNAINERTTNKNYKRRCDFSLSIKT